MGATGAALRAGPHPTASENLALGNAEIAKAKLPQAVRTGAQDVTCARCASLFSCGANASYCWCQTLPPLNMLQRPLDRPDHGCLCLRCLRADVLAQAAA